MTRDTILSAALNLSLRERRDLIERLAESLESIEDDVEFTAKEMQRIEERVKENDENSDDLITWEEARAQIIEKLKQRES